MHSGTRFARLAGIFDHSFAPHLDDRFSSAGALRDRLERVMQDLPPTSSLDDDIRELVEIFDTPAERRRGQADAVIHDGLYAVQRIYSDFVSKLGPALSLTQTNLNVTGGTGENTLFLMRRGRQDSVLSTTYEVQALGDELVLRMSGDDVYRTALGTPDWGDEFANNVSRWIAARIKATISNPIALPPEAAKFKEKNASDDTNGGRD